MLYKRDIYYIFLLAQKTCPFEEALCKVLRFNPLVLFGINKLAFNTKSQTPKKPINPTSSFVLAEGFQSV